jgi:hypothetical protein
LDDFGARNSTSSNHHFEKEAPYRLVLISEVLFSIAAFLPKERLREQTVSEDKTSADLNKFKRTVN